MEKMVWSIMKRDHCLMIDLYDVEIIRLRTRINRIEQTFHIVWLMVHWLCL